MIIKEYEEGAYYVQCSCDRKYWSCNSINAKLKEGYKYPACPSCGRVEGLALPSNFRKVDNAKKI